ncbi:hypothetical protein SUDANB121_03315 [Nocardiopsis dassonvillei]|uniref:hypothetical protein n=1 Tax=Nocardiopsis dassonvillei TaxID=2014 RepID=UPI003F56002D
MSYPGGPQMPYPPPSGGPPPKQGMSTGAKIGIGCGGCLGIFFFLALLGGCMSLLSGDTTPEARPSASASPEPVEEPSEETEAAQEAEEEPAAVETPEEEETSASVGDGVHRVGDDIEPGIYTTDGPDPDGFLPMCYYARLSGLSGELDDIIANNNIEGPGTVEVSESDAALELSGGCEWTLQD